MKASEFRNLTTAEIEQKVTGFKEELFNLRFQLATGQLDNPTQIRDVRKEIARAKTILRERELGYWVTKSRREGSYDELNVMIVKFKSVKLSATKWIKPLLLLLKLTKNMNCITRELNIRRNLKRMMKTTKLKSVTL